MTTMKAINYLRTGRELDLLIKLTAEQTCQLEEHGLASVDEEDDVASDTVDVWTVNEAAQDGHEDALTPTDLLALPRLWALRDTNRKLTDTEALDLLHFMYSAPEWSSSFNEDARGIICRSGRDKDIGGAQWDSH